MHEKAALNLAEVPYESGAIRCRYARVLSSDRAWWIRHGLFDEYHENGKVMTKGNYACGVEHGLWRDFHPNGQLAAEGHYHEGHEIGTWRFWGDNGAEESHCGDVVAVVNVSS